MNNQFYCKVSAGFPISTAIGRLVNIVIAFYRGMCLPIRIIWNWNKL